MDEFVPRNEFSGTKWCPQHFLVSGNLIYNPKQLNFRKNDLGNFRESYFLFFLVCQDSLSFLRTTLVPGNSGVVA